MRIVLTTKIRISDRTCCDCGGPVTLFGVPDKVWDGLGYAVWDWACLACVARRLNPEIDPAELGVEIDRQRHRFKLGRKNNYNGSTVPLAADLTPVARNIEEKYFPGAEEITAEEAGTGWRHE